MTDVTEVRRAAFEADCRANNIPFLWRCTGHGYTDKYANPVYQARWEGYNAALDSVVVELPAQANECEGGSYSVMQAIAANQVLAKFLNAIHAAGVKTK